MDINKTRIDTKLLSNKNYFMKGRKFIINSAVVQIPPDKIKQYMAYPECFVKEGNELYVFNGKIFKSNEREYCNESDCSVPIPSKIMDAQGNELCHCADDFGLDSHEGFIHDNVLYLLENVTEI